ncbi:SDR family oxidoreductase [Streptomyces sp. NPDC055722]
MGGGHVGTEAARGSHGHRQQDEFTDVHRAHCEDVLRFVRRRAHPMNVDDINSVAPGPTETELFRQHNPPGSPGEARYVAGVPLGRLDQPRELAAAVCFLLSEDAAFITGQTLRVDGGASVG